MFKPKHINNLCRLNGSMEFNIKNLNSDLNQQVKNNSNAIDRKIKQLFIAIKFTTEDGVKIVTDYMP